MTDETELQKRAKDISVLVVQWLEHWTHNCKVVEFVGLNPISSSSNWCFHFKFKTQEQLYHLNGSLGYDVYKQMFALTGHCVSLVIIS